MPSRPRSHQAAGRSAGGLAHRRAQLEQRWRARLERVTALSLAYHDEASSRRARLLATKAVAERQALAEIEAALDRIAAGLYGWCEQCRRPIGSSLLTAQPEARFCAACGRQTAHGSRTAARRRGSGIRRAGYPSAQRDPLHVLAST